MSLTTMYQNLRYRLLRRRVTRALTELLDEEHQVVDEAWAPPGTTADEILSWVEEHITSTPQLPGLQWYKVFIVRCTEAQYQEFMQGNELELSDVVAEWIGPRQQWWPAGRDQLAAGIPGEHFGLVLSMTNLAASVAAALDT